MSSGMNALFPKVFVITLNWNGRDDTIECLASLQKLNYPNYKIVVVDNGSTDGSVPALKARYADVTIIENGRNLGYAAGFNAGLKYAYEQAADYFLILNNDTILDAEAVTALVDVAKEDEKIGFVSGKIYRYENPDTLQRAGGGIGDPMTLTGKYVGIGEVDCGQHDAVHDYEVIDDVFLLVRRDVYARVGGYDSSFFLYFEETDWCYRVRRAGFRIVYTPKAKIWHKGNFGEKGLLSPKRMYYMRRNEILFMRKNATPAQFRRYWPLALRRLLINEARLLRRGHVQHAAACIRGVVSGLLWLYRNRHVAGPTNPLQ